MNKILSLILLCVAMSWGAGGNVTWIGGTGGSEALWSVDANWSPAATPTSIDTALFDNNSTSRCSVDVSFNVAKFSMLNTFDSSFAVNPSVICTSGSSIAFNSDNNALRKIALRGHWVRIGPGNFSIKNRFPAGATTSLLYYDCVRGSGKGDIDLDNMGNDKFFTDITGAQGAKDSLTITNTLSYPNSMWSGTIYCDSGTLDLTNAGYTISYGDSAYPLRLTDRQTKIPNGSFMFEMRNGAMQHIKLPLFNYPGVTLSMLARSAQDTMSMTDSVNCARLNLNTLSGVSGTVTFLTGNYPLTTGLLTTSPGSATVEQFWGSSIINITGGIGGLGVQLNSGSASTNSIVHMGTSTVNINGKFDAGWSSGNKLNILDGGTSSVTFNGSTNSPVVDSTFKDTLGWYDLTINKSGNGVQFLDTSARIQGDLVLTAGTLSIAGKSIRVWGDMLLNGTGTVNTGTKNTLAGDGTYHIGSTLGTLTTTATTIDLQGDNTLDIDKASTWDSLACAKTGKTTTWTGDGASNVVFNGMSLNGGRLNITKNLLLSQNALGSFTNSGTVIDHQAAYWFVFDEGGTVNLPKIVVTLNTGASDANLLIQHRSLTGVTANTIRNITDSIVSVKALQLDRFNSDNTYTDSVAVLNSALIKSGAGYDLTTGNSHNMGKFTLDLNNGTIDAGFDLIINGASAGKTQINCGAGNIIVRRNLNITGVGVANDPGTSTFTYAGASNATACVNKNWLYYNLDVAKTANGVIFSDHMKTTNDFTLTSGTVAFTAGIDSIDGNTMLTAGIFDATDDTIVFGGDFLAKPGVTITTSASTLFKFTKDGARIGFSGQTLPAIQLLGSANIDSGGTITQVTMLNDGDTITWQYDKKFSIVSIDTSDFNGSGANYNIWQSSLAFSRDTIAKTVSSVKLTPKLWKHRDTVFPTDTIDCKLSNGCLGSGGY